MHEIRELRESRRWTQAQLAYRLNVAPSTVYNWERWSALPRITQLRELAQVFGVLMNRIKLTPFDRLISVRDYDFVITAHRQLDKSWLARVIEYDWSRARVHPAGVIPGTDPPTNNPVLIVTGNWTATGATADEALAALERRIHDALDQAFTAGERSLDPASIYVEGDEDQPAGPDSPGPDR
ncbi:MAG: helix-turn-helix domain-containing protein [Chloroflexota bacterium]|nr:helix-turn-helix domain-containing protein [Chloroflexota bacterium]